MAGCNIRMRRLDNEEGRGEENRNVRDEMFKNDNANIVDGKTNKWVLEKAGVGRKLLGIVKERKMKYFGHIMRKEGSCLKKRSSKARFREVREGEDRGSTGCII